MMKHDAMPRMRGYAHPPRSPGQLPRHSWQISGFLGTKGKNFVQGCEQNRNHQVEENELTTLSVDESDRRRVYTYVVETTQ